MIAGGSWDPCVFASGDDPLLLPFVPDTPDLLSMILDGWRIDFCVILVRVWRQLAVSHVAFFGWDEAPGKTFLGRSAETKTCKWRWICVCFFS